MIFLLDTDTFIFLMRGLRLQIAKDERQRNWLDTSQRIVLKAKAEQTAGYQVGLSAITMAELEYGARNSINYEREIEIVRRVVTPFKLWDFDAMDCALQYGSVRHALKKLGQSIGPLDTLIAAHALALNAILVTNNMAEFSRVPGLNCENWSFRE
jgi:tRNA(fMet)-specific endonuclease VapC